MAGPNLTVIEIEDVSRVFGPHGRSRRPALDRITLTVDGSTRLGIVGESGSGKSTLTRLMVGLDQPTTGSIRFRGSDLRGLGPADWRDFRRNVQLIAQDTTSSFDPRRTLRDAVRRPAQELLGCSRAAADELVDETLEIVGLPAAMADRKPHEVSGGQRQRFSIARALVVKPQLIVCDEVVSALDVSVQGTVLNFLKRYCAEVEAGLVFVSHGLPATAFISDQIMVMKDGQVVERGDTMQVLRLSNQPYTRSLVEAYQIHEHATPGSDPPNLSDVTELSPERSVQREVAG
jgi:ABC-type glutathione transport system ATPase component